MPIPTPRRRLLALAAMIAATAGGLAAASPATAATSIGTVTGHVVTTSGAPAAGVPIVLDSTVHPEYPEDPVDNSHAHRYTVTTDASGDWTAEAQQGRYVVSVASSPVWIGDDTGVVTVVSGAATAPQTTAIRLATIHGTVVATEDGAAISGAAISGSTNRAAYLPISNDGNVLSTTDGGFAVRVPPGTVRLVLDASDRFEVTREETVAEGADLDLGAVHMDPSGEVDVHLRGRSGHGIVAGSQSVVVDGCRVTSGLVGDCPDVTVLSTGAKTALQLVPGAHTIRYEVRDWADAVVRHATRTVTAEAARTTTLAPIDFRADPVHPAKVRTGTYRSGKPVVVRVEGAPFTDGTHPHLRTTFLVDGHAVAPTSVAWRAPEPGARKILFATLPARWSSRATLSVQAVLHGTTDYSGSTTAAATLTRG